MMTESLLINDALRRQHDLFRSYLNFQTISPHLRKHNLLTDHEWEAIQNKATHDDQVDEFLKYLRLKGKDCLDRLILCLRSSLDHSGHHDILTKLEAEQLCIKQVDHYHFEDQDEFEKMVSNLNILYKAYKGKVAAKLESANNEIMAMKEKLEESKNEIISLRAKLEEKDTEKSQMEIQCNNYTRQIKDLKDELSTKDYTIADLQAQLEAKESIGFPMQETSDEVSDDEMTHESDDEMTHGQIACIGLVIDSSAPVKKCSSAEMMSSKKHLKVNQTLSLEDKMKSYKDKLASYREQCQILKEEKRKLMESKQELENEISHMKDQLEAISIHSRFSLQKQLSQSHSCGSLYSVGRIERDRFDTERTDSDSIERDVETPENGGSRTRTRMFGLASLLRGSTRRPSKTAYPQKALESASYEASAATITLPENINEGYFDPLYKGWLMKKGGQKKYWKKRWCILSSRFFFYFEGKEDPVLGKRPTGILPITKDMEVDDCLKDNYFVLYNTSKNGTMKSCKLDKSKGNYVQGHHEVYNLQAQDDDDKKKWIETFQFVFEQLKQLNTE